MQYVILASVIALWKVALVHPYSYSMDPGRASIFYNYKKVKSSLGRLQMAEINDGENKPQIPSRRIIKYDNVGDPIYEGELNASGSNGISILGTQVELDPVSASLLIFGLIAFNFLVLANL